jgi:putative membrane protein
MTIVAMMHGEGNDVMMGFMASWMALWGLLALALLVLAVVATVWLVKHLNGGGGSDNRSTLERRYAAGEIDREEFLQRREDLAGRR